MKTATTTPLRAIRVRYHGPTDTKGSRVSLVDERGIITARRYLPYDYIHNNAHEVAEAWLAERGWNIVAHAELENGSLVLTDDFRRESWE